MGDRRSEGGQAVVEVALVLPLIAMLALLLLQVALVVRDQVVVQHASRQGAREAAVSEGDATVRLAALTGTSLDPDRVEVEVRGRDGPSRVVAVEVRYSSPTGLPLVGGLVGDVPLRATTAMRVER